MRLALIVLALCAAGCGGDETAAVTGRVWAGGRPLAGGMVVFSPDASRGGTGPASFAELDELGRFSLRSERGMGAAVGWHRVAVAGPAGSRSPPRRYRDPSRSGLAVRITAGPNGFEFDLPAE